MVFFLVDTGLFQAGREHIAQGHWGLNPNLLARSQIPYPLFIFLFLLALVLSGVVHVDDQM